MWPKPDLHAFAGRLRLALAFAWGDVCQKRRRVALAVVGVAIGIAAVTSMLLFGYSIEARMRKSLDSLGAEVVMVSLESEGSPQRPDAVAQARALLRAMPEVDTVGRLGADPRCANRDSGPDEPPKRMLADTNVGRVLSLELERGRFLTPADAGQATVVLGARAVAKLRVATPSIGVGSVVLVCGSAVQVVGMLREHRGKDALPGLEIDTMVLGALAPASADANEGDRPLLLVRMRDQEAAHEALATRLAHVLGDKPRVGGAHQVNELRRQQAALYTTLLAVLGGISLLVGSLGIANVMLVAVTERRAELGVRKALGATRADIVLHFIAESGLICLLGAGLGLVVGAACTAVALQLAGLSLAISPGILAFTCATAIVCGIAAGAYPAKLAADTDVIESLRGAQ